MIKILFLEDEPNILEVTTEYMKMQGYDVTCVSNGEEAIKMLKKNDFNLAILDIMVPKITGIEVLEYINKSKKDIATIMLTALGDEQTQLKAFNLKTDDYVIKPFSTNILALKIDAILRRVGHKENAAVTYNDLTLEINNYQVHRQGQSIELTSKEFELLQMMLLSQGKVFSREEFLDTIWGYDSFVDSRAIDVHIKNLRSKLGKDIIQTVKGIGYRIEKETN